MVLTRIGSAKGDFASSLNGIRHRSKSPSRHSIARSFDGSCFEPTISTHDSYASHDFSSTLGGHLKSLKLFKTLRNVALKGCALPLFQESETGREVQNQRGVIRAQQNLLGGLLSRSAPRRTRLGSQPIDQKRRTSSRFSTRWAILLAQLGEASSPGEPL